MGMKNSKSIAAFGALLLAANESIRQPVGDRNGGGPPGALSSEQRRAKRKRNKLKRRARRRK